MKPLVPLLVLLLATSFLLPRLSRRHSPQGSSLSSPLLSAAGYDGQPGQRVSLVCWKEGDKLRLGFR